MQFIDEIIIKKVVVNIINREGVLLSREKIQLDLEQVNFFKKQLEKILKNDTFKKCRFKQKSKMKKYLEDNYKNLFDNFIDFTTRTSEQLYDIISNHNLKNCDLIFIYFIFEKKGYIAILKINYKNLYTKKIYEDMVDIHLQQVSVYPSFNQNIKEAIYIDLTTMDVRVREEKVEINGKKTNYLTSMLLEVETRKSEKEKLNDLERIIEKQNHKYYSMDDYERGMEVKEKLYELYSEQKKLEPEQVADLLFTVGEAREEVKEIIRKHQLDTIVPEQEKTLQKIRNHKIVTDDRIEVIVPLESKDNFKINYHEDGTISIIIKAKHLHIK